MIGDEKKDNTAPFVNWMRTQYRMAIIIGLVLISWFILGYFHVYLHAGTVFFHLFYIPIILASIWWGRRGIAVALLLSLSVIASHIFLKEYFNTTDDYFRIFMFFVIAAVVAILSERHARIQERLLHLNLVLGSIRDISHLITAAHDRDILLKGICANLVKNRSYFYAWVALFDDSGRLISSAEAGLAENFQPMAEMLINGSLPLCVKRALNNKGVVLIKDPQIECAGCPLTAQYPGSGRMTIDLSYGGRLRGILSVSIPEDLLSDRDELVLFKEIAADVEFGLSDIELRNEHENALEKLRESEERFRSIVENAPFGYYRTDRNGLFQYVNAEWERMLGFSRDDAIGRHFSITQAPERKGQLEYLMARVLGGETARGEFEMLRKDGSATFQTYNIQPVYSHGMIIGAEGFLNDITERKEAERARERSQQMMSQIIEGSPIPTFVIDENHLITHWNRACEILTGFPSEIMIGTNRQWEPFYSSESLSLADMIMYSALNPALAQKYGGEYHKSPLLEGAADSERFFSELDGRWLFFTAALLRDADRNIIGAVETLQDITSRKRAEEEILKLNWELEQRVIERTKELERANRELDEHRGHLEELVFQRTAELEREAEERRRAVEERERAFTELEQIFNSTPVGMRVIDRDFKTIRVNERFTEMFSPDVLDAPGVDGAAQESVLLRSDRVLLERILKGERYVEYEIVTRINDEDLICIVHATPYLANDGNIIGIIQNYTNITEMRSLQSGIMHIAEVERQRIGQDLHDGLGQNLTAVTFLIEALKEKMDQGTDGGIGEIENIEGMIRSAIVQTRSLSRMLSPVEMEKNGLRLALDDMAASTEKVYGVSCKIYQTGNFFINDNQTATHLFYIAREAVTNAIKHGNAEHIKIDLIADESRLAMCIRDDGTGSGEKKSSGLGLRIMKYRASIVGAEFHAGTQERGGFEVKVRLRTLQPRQDETIND